MFSLIVTVVSIALAVALVAATMFYGGDTLTEGRSRSDAAAYIAGGQQIVGGLQMYNAMEGRPAEDLNEVTSHGVYLASLPVMKGSGSWSIDNSVVPRILTISIPTEEICTGINALNLLDPRVSSLPANKIYACITSGGNNRTFTMRY